MFSAMQRIVSVALALAALFLSSCGGGSSSSQAVPTSAPSATPAPTSAPTAKPSATPTSTPTVSPTATPTAASSASYYFCVGVPILTAADLATPPQTNIPGEHIESPCALISPDEISGNCLDCNGLAINNLSQPHEARGSQITTCIGSCIAFSGAPSSVTTALQVVSIPSNGPQLTGQTYNIEDNGAHDFNATVATCSSVGSPYSLSGGGGTFTITQVRPVTTGNGLCDLDIYDQYNDYILIPMSAQNS